MAKDWICSFHWLVEFVPKSVSLAQITFLDSRFISNCPLHISTWITSDCLKTPHVRNWMYHLLSQICSSPDVPPNQKMVSLSSQSSQDNWMPLLNPLLSPPAKSLLSPWFLFCIIFSAAHFRLSALSLVEATNISCLNDCDSLLTGLQILVVLLPASSLLYIEASGDISICKSKTFSWCPIPEKYYQPL